MARTPAVLEVRTLLSDLLARQVDVTAAAPWSPDQGEPSTFALYADDALRIRSAVVADLAFSAYAASAIALLPVHHARSAIMARRLSEELRENLDEVLDICAGPQNGECVPRTTLYQVHHAGEPVSRRVAVFGAVLGRRLDLTVCISGYGRGRLSFVGVDPLPS